MPPARRRANPPVGAHLSIAGGLAGVLPRARGIGAEAVQVFPSSPRQWRTPARDPAEVEGVGAALAAARLPLFVHAIYLINLASPDASLRDRSATALGEALWFGALSGAEGVVTHVGSHRGAGFASGAAGVADAVGLARSRAQVRLAAAGCDVRPLPRLLLETSAGARDSLGVTAAELGALTRRVGGSCGVCLDTAHLFAAGHPVHTAGGLDRLLGDLAREVGLEALGLVHLNDCATPLGSRRDRHENLGEGQLGAAGLRLWLRCPELRRVPFVIETPGFAQAGPDRRNVSRARRLRSGRG